jgi:hypothetical protein
MRSDYQRGIFFAYNPIRGITWALRSLLKKVHAVMNGGDWLPLYGAFALC